MAEDKLPNSLAKSDMSAEESKASMADALLSLSLESQVPGEQARALLALNAAQTKIVEADETNLDEEDEWLELYGIDEEYAQMVRETLGEVSGADGKRPRFQEDFHDDE